jgi:predicted GTPase
MHEGEFYAACQAAVQETTAKTEALSLRLESLIDDLVTGEDSARSGDPFSVLMAEIRAELQLIRSERLGDLGTFNIVLFGRTGTGKSCLIEALTRGDGRTVSSDGSPDCTRMVKTQSWGPLKVFDTPGFAGMERQAMWAELEKARRAAASADVVALCFDDTNQRFEEFETIARWIGDYQKVAVAVLNIKNPRWRWPGHGGLDTQVAGHARHVREELARIGLDRIPVIAVHALNAMFARTGADYRGPQKNLRATYRERFGAEGLAALSNFSALEELLTELIRCGGAELRLGSVYRFIATTLARAETRLRAAAAEAGRLAELEELGIAATLAALGLPNEDASGYGVFLARLRRLEELRGAEFELPEVARAVAYGRDLIVSRFTPLERETMTSAREFIHQKVEERKRPADTEFDRAVYRHDLMEDSANMALKDYQLFLQRSHDVIARDLYEAFKREKRTPVAIDAGRGKWLGRVSIGGSVVGITGSLGVLLLASNPVGWGVVATAVVGGAALEGGGEYVRRKVAAGRERALAAALADADKAVGARFTRLTQRVEAEFMKLRQIALTESIGGPVEEALNQRGCQRSCTDTALRVSTYNEAEPGPAHHPLRLVWHAVQECERKLAVGDSLGRNVLWLGAIPGDAPDTPSAHSPPARPDVRAALQKFQDHMPDPVARGTARAWITEVDEALGDRTLTRELRALARRKQPTVVFCGDYDSGKSSLILRLFKGDLDIEISPLPGQNRVKQYQHPSGLTLVDTPGFQATAARASDETVMEIATAAVVVLVFTPGLATCDPADLTQVLHGHPASHVPGQLGRCLFVVNRADGLGTDPEYDPAGFTALRERKLEQLRRDVPGLIHGAALSAAPFGASDRRPWDGLDEFTEGLVALRGRLQRDQAEVATLNGGQLLLGRYLTELTQERAGLAPRIEKARFALTNAERMLDEARALRKERQEDLRHRVGRLIDGAISLVLSTKSTERRNTLAQQLERLDNHPQFQQITQSWCEETDSRIDAFEALCAQQMSVGFNHSTPRENFPGLGLLTDARLLGNQNLSPAAFAATWTGKAGGVAAKAERFAASGGKFAKILKGAGPTLGIASGGVSVYLLVKELKNGTQNEAGRRKAIASLRRVGDSWAQQTLSADPALQRLAALCDLLAETQTRLAAELAGLEDAAQRLDDRSEACVTLIGRAAGLLGTNPMEAQ